MTAVECLVNATSMEIAPGKNGMFTVDIGLSDAAGSLDVRYTFDHDELIRREVYLSEEDERLEDIHYPHFFTMADGERMADWSRWEKEPIAGELNYENNRRK